MQHWCFALYLLAVTCGCTTTARPSRVTEYVKGLIEHRLSGQLKAGEAGKLEQRIALQGIAGRGAIESELLAAGDTLRGDELYEILGRLGNPSSIPVMLNYYYRREIIHDLDDTNTFYDEAEGLTWRLDTAPVVIKKLSGRQEDWDGEIMAQLRLCYPLFEKNPEVQEFILGVGSGIAGVYLDGVSGQAMIELLRMGLSSSNEEIKIAALDLFGNAPTLAAADEVIDFIKRAPDTELALQASQHVCCFLPDGGPYSQFKTDEELDAWLRSELVPWWETNRKSLQLNNDHTGYEMKKD